MRPTKMNGDSTHWGHQESGNSELYPHNRTNFKEVPTPTLTPTGSVPKTIYPQPSGDIIIFEVLFHESFHVFEGKYNYFYNCHIAILKGGNLIKKIKLHLSLSTHLQIRL